jgi:hypothetical protein
VDRRECVGYNCTYTSRMKLRVELAPLNAVPHKKKCTTIDSIFLWFHARLPSRMDVNGATRRQSERASLSNCRMIGA